MTNKLFKRKEQVEKYFPQLQEKKKKTQSNRNRTGYREIIVVGEERNNQEMELEKKI